MWWFEVENCVSIISLSNNTDTEIPWNPQKIVRAEQWLFENGINLSIYLNNSHQQLETMKLQEKTFSSLKNPHGGPAHRGLLHWACNMFYYIKLPVSQI